eukprot:6471690-Amphidinium_carterae.1
MNVKSSAIKTLIVPKLISGTEYVSSLDAKAFAKLHGVHLHALRVAATKLIKEKAQDCDDQELWTHVSEHELLQHCAQPPLLTTLDARRLQLFGTMCLVDEPWVLAVLCSSYSRKSWWTATFAAISRAQAVTVAWRHIPPPSAETVSVWAELVKLLGHEGWKTAISKMVELAVRGVHLAPQIEENYQDHEQPDLIETQCPICLKTL